MAPPAPKKVSATELLRIREGQWGARLRGCSLVAELKVEEQHSTQVARVLGKAYANWAGTPKAEQLFQARPACVAVAITGIAARDYRQGELWPELWAGLGYRGTQKEQGIWGKGFLTALERLGLPVFSELPMPYLGPILMHTGIPNYCLEDYFRLISQRRATDPGLDAEGFLQWATARPNRLNELDMPARRLLEYGTEYALDFVDRTFELLDQLRAPVPDLDRVGLPPRVMARAQELADEGRIDLRPPRSTGAVGGRTRTEQPRIGLDPFGRGIEVVLPPVGDTPDGFARWTVTADGVSTTIRSQAQWAGVTEAAPSTTFTLLQPARTVVVAMEGWDHQTELQVIDPGAPLLVFTEDGRRISQRLPLPPDLVWAVYPAEGELVPDGSCRVVIEGQLPLGWNGWKLQQLDLSQARSLSLKLPKHPGTSRPVRGYTRPRIVTGPPLPGVTTPYGTPVHTQVPEIWLPGEAGAKTVWTVELRPSAGGEPLVSRTYEVSGSDTLTDVFDQAPRPLLGSFELIIRGPLGRGTSRKVFLAEHLGVRFTPSVRLFGPEGLMASRTELSPAIGASANPRVVSLGPEERAAVVEYRAGERSEPLVITPPHLQVMHERADQSLIWRAGPLRLVAEGFDEEPGALLVQLPGVKALPPLQVIVGERIVQEVPPSGRPQEGIGRYDLARLADTVAEYKRAELVLEAGGRPVRLAAVRPRQLAAGALREGDGLRLEKFVPVEGLTAGIYAANAPWREPTVSPVSEAGAIELPEELREAGPLLVLLQVDDPWVPVEWPRWPERYLLVSGEGHLASEDAEETALSRFMAGEREFPAQVEDLRRVWVLIRLAKQLKPDSDVQRFRMDCARPLQQRPFEALVALAELGLPPEETVTAVISSGLAATAVPDLSSPAEVRKLWPVAPLLAALAGGLSDPDCFEAAARQCGETLEQLVEEGRDPHASVGRFDAAVERLIHLEPQQIEAIWRAARIVPRALLDADSRASAALRLFDRREEKGLREAGKLAATAVQRTLPLLEGRPELIAQLKARMHPQGKGGWFALPAASTAFALLARLAARGHPACRNLEQLFREYWLQLAAGAPDLVLIDLILAELLLGFGKTETP